MAKRKKDKDMSELKDAEDVKKAKYNVSCETNILEYDCNDDPANDSLKVNIAEGSGRKTRKRKRIGKMSTRTKREKDRARKRLERNTANKLSESEWRQMDINIDAYYSSKYGIEQSSQIIPGGGEFESSNVDVAIQSTSNVDVAIQSTSNIDVAIQSTSNVNETVQSNFSDSSRKKRKRDLYKKRYQEDSEFRERKKLISRTRYQEDVMYRKKQMYDKSKRYHQDRQFNDKLRMQNRQLCQIKYRTDKLYQDKKKQYSALKYRIEPRYRQLKISLNAQKYKTSHSYRQSHITRSIQKYRNNINHRLQVKAASVCKYKRDLQHREQVKQKSIQKYQQSAAFRQKIKAKLHDDYSKNSAIKSRKMQMVLRRRTHHRKSKNNIALFFRENVRDGPIFVCFVCHKFKFHAQVVACDIEKYSSSEKARDIASQCIDIKISSKCTKDCEKNCELLEHNKVWICFTCHRHLLKGQMPADAAADNLQLQPVPDQLKKLNPLERQLLSLRIPFMKLINLPKGCQKGIVGPCVSVPTDIENTTKVLPRCEHDNELIKLKLKRKFAFKGHSQYQYVSPYKLQKGLQYLQQNNQWYKNIEFHQNWTLPFADTRSTANSDINYEQQIEDQQIIEEDSITEQADDDKEDDDPSTKDKGLPFDTCLQPADIGQDILDQYFDGIFCLAPGEGKTPVSMLKEEGNEAMSFPAQFPDGCRTYDEKRSIKLTRLRYFHSRLLNVDSRFASDTQYVFYAQYLSEMEQVVSQVSIALRKGTSNDNTGKDITADMIRDGNELKSLLKTDQGYKFLTPIRGTPPYWQATLKDLFAMIRQLGIPTWFCTFSATDMRWSEIMNILLQQQGIDKCLEDLDWLQKCEILKNSAVMNSVLFDHRFHTLLKSIIIDKGVIGKVKDHFYRIEFQQRGSPHTHCLFWIENAPLLDKDDDSVSVTDPSNELSPQQMMKKAKETLQNLWMVLNNIDLEEITTSNLFAAACTTQEQFEEATNILTKRTSAVLKRTPQDVWINQYNPTLLRCWNANMDIQYITDAYSCVMYIISYISKAEREMGLVLEEARKEATEGNLDAQDAMKKIGGAYFHHREVSAQEAAYRVCGLHLKQSSRKVQFIPAGKDPVRMSKPLSLIHSQTKDDEDIWMPTIMERYRARPSQKAFEKMSLATFCSLYRVLSSSQIPKDISKGSQVFELQSGLGFIRKRTRSDAAIIRYPRFSQQRDSELYYKSLLQLFLPHRNDIQLKPPPFESFQEFYTTGTVKLAQYLHAQSVSDIVNCNKKKYEVNADAIDEAQEILEKVGPLEDAWAMISPEGESDRLECQMEKQTQNIPSEESNNEIPELDINKSNSDDNQSIELSTQVLSTKNALPLLRSLNKEQKNVFYNIRQWCLDKVNGKQPKSFQLFITGGAGTGKSHLIKCIQYEAHKILSTFASNPDDTVVLLTAPTGTAAFNISGTTLHQGFTLPKHLSLPYQYMRDEKLNTLRCKLQSLQILIIDEISMVGQKVLTYVHERLRQVMQSGNALFGNVSVIAVGDFYQLPPVKQTALYDLRPKNYFSLWTANFSIVQLHQIMRQRDDISFAELLNRVRVKQKGKSLEEEDISCLQECQGKPHDKDILHIFGTNAEVGNHNKKMLDEVCKEHACITAQDYEKDPTTGKLIKKDTPYLTSNDYLPSDLVLAKGARVMLIRNVDISDGLVNGVVGTVCDITFPSTGRSQSFAVSIKFDNNRIGQKQRHSTQSLSSDLSKKVVITVFEETLHNSALRYQLPLRLSWACTVHKVQGIITDKLVVSFKKIFSPGMAYVALSRVTSLAGLVVTDFDQDKIYCAEQVSNVLQKMPPFLTQLENTEVGHNTTNILLHNIQGLLPHIHDLKANEDIADTQFICLTETWIKNQATNPVLHNFQFYSKTRFTSYSPVSSLFKTLKELKNGGVAVFCKNSVNFHEVPINQCNIETIAFKIPEISTTVVVIYKPDIYKTSVFLQQLQLLFQQLPQSTATLVIGDFNQDLLKDNSTILNFMKDNGYQQLVDAATTDGNTLIDHVYLKGHIQVDISVVPTYYSYHNMILMKVSSLQNISS